MYGWMLVVRTNRYIHYQLELKGGKNFRPKHQKGYMKSTMHHVHPVDLASFTLTF